MTHLKTITVPTTWPVKRKGNKFIVRPMPGKSYDLGLPMALIFKNLLKYCKTTKEVKSVLRENDIFVDGKIVKDVRYMVGLMDVLSIPSLKEHYRMLLNTKGKLYLMPIDKNEAQIKVTRIIKKTILKKGKIQLNMLDSRNLIVKKDEFKIGDSVLLSLPKQELKEVLKLDKGNHAYLIAGRHIGEHGEIAKVSAEMATIKTKESKFETPKKYVFVVGKEKPLVKLEK